MLRARKTQCTGGCGDDQRQRTAGLRCCFSSRVIKHGSSRSPAMTTGHHVTMLHHKKKKKGKRKKRTTSVSEAARSETRETQQKAGRNLERVARHARMRGRKMRWEKERSREKVREGVPRRSTNRRNRRQHQQLLIFRTVMERLGSG